MSKTKIGAFGDAVTAGTSAKLDVFHDCFQNGTTTVNMVRETQTWRSIMARIVSDWIEDGVELINAGLSGDTSSKGLARMERDVLSNAPDYVLVLFGTEDALVGVEPAAFRANLEKIVSGIAGSERQAHFDDPHANLRADDGKWLHPLRSASSAGPAVGFGSGGTEVRG